MKKSIAALIVLFVISGGYFTLRQYGKYKEQQLKNEQLSLEIDQLRGQKVEVDNNSNVEQSIFEKLKKELEVTKGQPTQVKAVTPTSKNIESDQIKTSDLTPYLSGIVNIQCVDAGNSSKSGSGSILLNNGRYLILTNNHVISDITGCAIFIDEGDVYELDMSEIYRWNSIADIAGMRVKGANLGNPEKSIGDLNAKISYLPNCSSKMPLGSSVAIVGYPVSTQETIDHGSFISERVSRTITNGIVSAYSSSNDSLPYSNYFISAKLDSGNSGGLAFSKDNGKLCVLGVPTWVSKGNFENQGVVQNINNVFFKMN